MKQKVFSACIIFLLFMVVQLILAPETIAAQDIDVHEGNGGGHHEYAIIFLWIAIIILLAKLSSLVERFGQAPVLGELMIGVILGNFVLLGITFVEPIKDNNILKFLSELGVVLLLFQVGLDSNIHEMRKVGIPALLVAIIGVVVPFLLGTYVVGPWLMPGLEFSTYLFLGATLTATSVGITARVFQDLGKIQSKEARVVLGAAVFDDVFGLIILAIVSAIVVQGTIGLGEIGIITLKAFVFLFGSIIIGSLLAPHLGKLFSNIHSGVGLKFGLAISCCLFVAYFASIIGLAPIIGAFASGLILDSVYFRGFKEPALVGEIKKITATITDKKAKQEINTIIERHSEHDLNEFVDHVGHFIIPIFFVMTGLQVKLDVLFDIPILLVALGFTAAACIGKIVSGLAAGKGINKTVVGFGMMPRGEVGLIFANIGKSIGVIDDVTFSVIVIMVIITTLATPPILTLLLLDTKGLGLKQYLAQKRKHAKEIEV